MSAYKDLMCFARETFALGQVAGRLGWDQETMMPPGATVLTLIPTRPSSKLMLALHPSSAHFVAW